VPPKDERCLTADRPEDIPLWDGYLLTSYICWKYGLERAQFLTLFKTRALLSLDSGDMNVQWAVKRGAEQRVREAIFRAWFNEVVRRLR